MPLTTFFESKTRQHTPKKAWPHIQHTHTTKAFALTMSLMRLTRCLPPHLFSCPLSWLAGCQLVLLLVLCCHWGQVCMIYDIYISARWWSALMRWQRQMLEDTAHTHKHIAIYSYIYLHVSTIYKFVHWLNDVLRLLLDSWGNTCFAFISKVSALESTNFHIWIMNELKFIKL